MSYRMRNTKVDVNQAVCSVNNAAGLGVFSFGITGATKVLRLNVIGVGVTSGSTALNANQWYRITLSYVITNSTTYTVKAYLDGVLEITVSNTGTLTRTGTDRISIGADSALGASQQVWIDDLSIDNGTDSADPGTTNVNSLRVTNKRPFANGTTNGFTTQIGSGNSGYGSGHADEVNEQPLSTTNGWSMVGAGSAVTEEYTLEASTAGDFSLAGYRIIGKLGWIYASSLSSETGQIVADGAATNISLTSTNTLFTKAVTSQTYPVGGTDIGIVTSTDLTTVSLYEAGMLFVLEPGGGRPRVNAGDVNRGIVNGGLVN